MEGVAGGGGDQYRRWLQPLDLTLVLGRPIQDLFKGEWSKLVTSSHVELILELHPVQPQGVQESGEALHDQKDGYRQNSKYGKNDEHADKPSPALHSKADGHDHGPEHLRQLRMCQAEGPEPEVGGCVRNAAQAVLDRVDGLMHKDVSKVELLFMVIVSPMGTCRSPPPRAHGSAGVDSFDVLGGLFLDPGGLHL